MDNLDNLVKWFRPRKDGYSIFTNDAFWCVSADTKTCGSPLYLPPTGGLYLPTGKHVGILTYIQTRVNKKATFFGPPEHSEKPVRISSDLDVLNRRDTLNEIRDAKLFGGNCILQRLFGKRIKQVCYTI